ncbi:M18 family aminopeptidase [Pseudomethylobacillus aquaticus]|uniref:M18 family aminopeptidase n=1 Tax=Pseudomethylobacillus aquaticus TaxID=2676064 RepID=A0A3N0V2T2_9PROT|nr:M18 family aminopeptidase [Pseudomethylobacillus aquaticus]ROH87033.1 M18 family aminopeptidase [Pseudomethylobacillus aquaticus]
MLITDGARAHAQHLLDFIDASPSPWHVVNTASEHLLTAGYIPLEETQPWALEAGGRYFVARGGALIAFTLGTAALHGHGMRIIGAHTDSPGLRLKPHADHCCDGMQRLGVEVYGGPILATFTDRDLSLAGQVMVRSAHGHDRHLLRFDSPLVRLPNLAIHMNREVNDSGLKLHKQNELPLLLGRQLDADTPGFKALVAGQLDIADSDILSMEFNVYDTQPGSFWGVHEEFIADSQLDNLASCHAGLTALLATASTEHGCMLALFDHEEVGSSSHSGADGSLIADVMQRIFALQGLNEEQRQIALARSFFISADMAHAYHPNFPQAYEPQHRVMINGGPVIKANANQRYSTNAETAARFVSCCEQAGVRYQQYAHRTDLGCGSTIGPLVAAGLGVPSVDVGAPMWAMHSLRESAGVQDHADMIAVLSIALSAPR